MWWWKLQQSPRRLRRRSSRVSNRHQPYISLHSGEAEVIAGAVGAQHLMYWLQMTAPAYSDWSKPTTFCEKFGRPECIDALLQANFTFPVIAEAAGYEGTPKALLDWPW